MIRLFCVICTSQIYRLRINISHLRKNHPSVHLSIIYCNKQIERDADYENKYKEYIHRAHHIKNLLQICLVSLQNKLRGR